MRIVRNLVRGPTVIWEWKGWDRSGVNSVTEKLVTVRGKHGGPHGGHIVWIYDRSIGLDVETVCQE